MHAIPEVNWFENEVVRRIDACSIIDSDPRLSAEFNAVCLIRTWHQSLWVEYLHEVQKVVRVELHGRILGRANQVERTKLGDLIWEALQKKKALDPPLFKRVCAFVLFAHGTERADISRLVGLSPQRLRQILNGIIPTIPADIDEVNLSRVARDLVEQNVNTMKKRIVYYLAVFHNQSHAAAALGIRRQRVSQLAKSIPPAYRFDEDLRHWPTCEDRPRLFEEYRHHIEALELPFGYPWNSRADI